MHDGNKGPWVTNWAFYPGYQTGDRTNSAKGWTATDIFTSRDWAEKFQAFHNDAAFAVVTNGTNLGYSKGCNIGIARREAGEDVVLMNNDVVVTDPDWLTKLQDAAFGLPDTGVVGTRLVNEDGNADLLMQMGLGVVGASYTNESEATLEYARHFTPPLGASRAIGHIKRAVQSGVEMSFSDGLALERELQQRLFESEDAREGIAANLEKRKAAFKGN